MKSGATSQEVSQHLLDFITISRILPSLIASDTGSFQAKGNVQSFVINLQKKLSKQNQLILDSKSQSPEPAPTEEPAVSIPTLENDLQILELTDLQKTALKIAWEDLRDAGPPLFPIPLQSHPPPYKQSLTSQLSHVDSHCRKLRKLLQYHVDNKTTTRDLETILLKYEYQENFLKKNPSSGLYPGMSHLGKEQVAASTSLSRILGMVNPCEKQSTEHSDWADLLRQAKLDLDLRHGLQDNLAISDAKFKKSKSTTISSESHAMEKFTPLSLVMCKNESKKGKTDGNNKYVGPNLLIGFSFPDKNLFTLELDTGLIKKFHRKKVKPYLPASFYSLPKGHRTALNGPFKLDGSGSPSEKGEPAFFPIPSPKADQTPTPMEIQKYYSQLLSPTYSGNAPLLHLMELFSILELDWSPDDIKLLDQEPIPELDIPEQPRDPEEQLEEIENDPPPVADVTDLTLKDPENDEDAEKDTDLDNRTSIVHFGPTEMEPEEDKTTTSSPKDLNNAPPTGAESDPTTRPEAPPPTPNAPRRSLRDKMEPIKFKDFVK